MIMAKVCHSQCLNDPPLRPWVACHKDGEVLAAHCTCKPGLGEVCAHVAAVLFYLEVTVKISHGVTSTSLPCEWIKTSTAKGRYLEATDIDFTSSQTKKRKIDEGSTEKTTSSIYARIAKLPELGDEEKKQFYNNLQASGAKCAVLSLLDSHHQNFIPVSITANLPPTLTELAKRHSCQADDDEQVQAACRDIMTNLTLTRDQGSTLERLTRKQSNCKLWINYRAGRLTASNFKRCCRTKVDKPSVSLLCATQRHTSLRQRQPNMGVTMRMKQPRTMKRKSRDFMTISRWMMLGCMCILTTPIWVLRQMG
ncbi:uncharacterized protein KZ484_001659 isoform 1-T1 [Pholidichthys leucotaenia]